MDQKVFERKVLRKTKQERMEEVYFSMTSMQPTWKINIEKKPSYKTNVSKKPPAD